MSWQLDTTRHVKIWFSENPNQWTYQINQLRLIRHLVKHPHHTIHLFGCERILSPKAQAELYAFCVRHKIQYHDIKEIQLADDTEKQLLEFANKEIKCAMEGKGGCMATASDIVRLFDHVLELGIYSDLDVEIDFRKVPSEVLIDDFLIDMGSFSPYGCRDSGSYYISNNFIAAPAKHEFIHQVKEIILNNYTEERHTFGANNEFLVRPAGDISFETRTALQNKLSVAYSDQAWDDYYTIIMSLAGPNCFNKAFYSYVCKKNNLVFGSDLALCMCEKLQYKKQLLKEYSVDIGAFGNDMSWKPGSARIAELEAQMHKSAATIQRRWRN